MSFENADYTVAWLSALHDERASAEALLDDEHEDLLSQPGDDNAYTLGKIGPHNVVIVGLPTGTYGTISAATVAANLLRSFPNIRFGLLVGVGGGVPSPDDLRLGDIVVSTAEGVDGGVIQYDFGSAIQNKGFVRKGSLNKPPPVLTNAIGKLRAKAARKGYSFQQHFEDMLEKNPKMKPRFTRPSNDDLYEPDYLHESGDTDCAGCSAKRRVSRPQRLEEESLVYYGTIGSANRVLRDASVRDKLHQQSGIRCFETEAAGLMDNFPCIVIRGISDYADTHKNKEWQPYAGAIAAAFAKELVLSIAPGLISQTPQASQILDAVNKLEGRQFQQLTHLDKIEAKIDLSKLPCVRGAAYDSFSVIDESHSRCLRNTRVEILAEISKWAIASTSKHVFWLNGMAGTGKSTIARTLAAHFASNNMLGASFFFKNGEGDLGKASYLFTTIAAQLIQSIPDTQPLVRKALEKDPFVADKALRQQFEKLVLAPLQEVKNPAGSVMVIIIDALDECDSGANIKTIIQLLAELQLVRTSRIRTIITSRPEPSIRWGFQKISKSAYQGLTLHEVELTAVRHDISLFFEHQFEEIRSEHDLPKDWPGQEAIETLTNMAIPLFIFAATVCRFIGHGSWNPRERLNHVLQYQTKAGLNQRDKTYKPILDDIFGWENEQDKSERELLVQNFQDVLGPIVVLADPLSLNSFAALLQLDTQTIYRHLDKLRSVLNFPDDPTQPIQLLHLSFSNYLLDQNRRGKDEFWIDETATHRLLAHKCLDLLRTSSLLKEDICDLRQPGFYRSEIEHATLSRCLPPELQYACSYWVYHLEKAQCKLSDGDEVHLFLRERLLYWLEALGLLGRASTCVEMVTTLQSLLDMDGSHNVAEFLQDAWRFVLVNHTIADIAPLQLYSSSLVFAPQQSLIARGFNFPKWLDRLSPIDVSWNSTLILLDDHTKWVNSVAFSPDGKQLVSASDDKSVKIWNAATGSLQQTLEGHSSHVRSVAFSHDGKLLASASFDKTVKIWDASTSFLLYTLEGHRDAITSVAFSPDGGRLASGSYDKSIKLWATATGSLEQTLEGHLATVTSVTFSPNGNRIASTSFDGSVRVWDTAIGCLKQTLKGHRDWVTTVAFSPDGSQLASGSFDKTVSIWDVTTGFQQRILRGHSDRVNSVHFSPDRQQLASASYDKTIRLWNISTGALKQILRGHTDAVESVAFSADGKQLASGSYDKTIRIWDAAAAPVPLQQTTKGHTLKINSIAISPTGTLFASGSSDKTIKIWDLVEGTLQFTISRLPPVLSLAFSPDGRLLASSCYGKKFRVWDVTTKSLLHSLEDEEEYATNPVIFSPDNEQLVSGSITGEVGIWNVVTGSLQNTINAQSERTASVALSSHGKYLASASGHRKERVKIFDAISGSLRVELEDHSTWITSIAFSRDGNQVASSSEDKIIKIWDATTGSLQKTLVWQDVVNQVFYDPILALLNTTTQYFDDDSGNNTGVAPRFGEVQHDMYVAADWIMRGSKRILWLPPEYRATAFACMRQTVILGSASGRMTLFRFSIEDGTA